MKPRQSEHVGQTRPAEGLPRPPAEAVPFPEQQRQNEIAGGIARADRSPRRASQAFAEPTKGRPGSGGGTRPLDRPEDSGPAVEPTGGRPDLCPERRGIGAGTERLGKECPLPTMTGGGKVGRWILEKEPARSCIDAEPAPLRPAHFERSLEKTGPIDPSLRGPGVRHGGAGEPEADRDQDRGPDVHTGGRPGHGRDPEGEAGGPGEKRAEQKDPRCHPQAEDRAEGPHVRSARKARAVPRRARRGAEGRQQRRSRLEGAPDSARGVLHRTSAMRCVSTPSLWVTWTK